MRILPAFVCNAVAQEPCKLTAMETGSAASIRDGRTLLFSVGRELRLTAIEVTDKSRSAVQSLVAGRHVRLKQLGPERDHYERPVAFVYVDDSQACADVLLSAKRTARADPNFAPLRLENIAQIAAARVNLCW